MSFLYSVHTNKNDKKDRNLLKLKIFVGQKEKNWDNVKENNDRWLFVESMNNCQLKQFFSSALLIIIGICIP